MRKKPERADSEFTKHIGSGAEMCEGIIRCSAGGLLFGYNNG